MTTAAPESSRLLTKRTRHTRWLVILLLPVVFLLAPPPGRPEWLHGSLESLGVICLVICLTGRGWTSVYIAGRKSRELVVVGPYSVVRNPLYVFSFVGLVGVCLLSGMMTLLLIAVIVFALYYQLVVRREEEYLSSLHGTRFAQYTQRVPRWFPKLSGWRDVQTLEAQPRLILRHLGDSSLFFLACIVFEVREYMWEVGVLPPLLHVF
jgi:protein-S-isoprenylcysteine O-methyltransferase Ste14